MKTTAKILLLILMGLCLFWLKLSIQTDKPPTKPNIVSYKTQAQSQQTAEKKSEAHVLPHRTEANDLLDANTETGDEQAVSFMTLYRWSREWRTCRQIRDYQEQDDWFDAAQYLTNQFSRQDHTTASPMTTQIEALQSHANRCLDLQDKLANLGLSPAKPNPNTGLSEPHYTTKHLMQHLRTYKTNTEKERALAHVIDLSFRWIQLFNDVLVYSAGNDQVNKAAISTLKEELRELRIQQHNMLRSSADNEDKEQQMKAFFAVFTAIENKEKNIQDLMVIDETQRAQAIADFTVLNDQLFKLLNSQDPDVFYEVHVTLEKDRTLSFNDFNIHKTNNMRDLKRPFTEYVFPEEVVMERMGLSNPIWFNPINAYATQLYLCELGADCGPTSEWIKHHCLHSYSTLNAQSCELDLPTFYQEHLLSPNQFTDVQTVLSIVKDLYAY